MTASLKRLAQCGVALAFSPRRPKRPYPFTEAHKKPNHRLSNTPLTHSRHIRRLTDSQTLAMPPQRSKVRSSLPDTTLRSG